MIAFRPSLVALALSATVISGCSQFGKITSGTDDPCATLQGIVADYPQGFADFRGSSSSYRLVTLYEARQPLIKGHCEIWAWGNGDSAYTCTVGAPNADVAAELYAEANNRLAQCIGGEWLAQETTRDRDGRAAGEVTRYQRAGNQGAAVSVHRVQDRSRHSVYLYIGTPGRSPEPAN